MKFFKHFTDAHRGKSLQLLRRKFSRGDHGLKAVGIYWTLVELCAEKMEKSRDEEFTDAHCNFEFSLKYLRDTLGTHQTKNCVMYLQCLHDVCLMSVQCSDDVCTIYMPKLLECIDRDSNRTRTGRALDAPKIKNKIKIKNIKADPPLFSIEDAFANYPIGIKGPGAETRFKSQIKSQEQYDQLVLSIENYKWFLALPQNNFRPAKQSWSSYLGSKSSGFFWRDFIVRPKVQLQIEEIRPTI